MVTRDRLSAAPRAARRAASLLTGALFAAALAGCSGGFPQFGDAANANLAQKAKPAVALSPAQGVPQKYAGKMNDQLAASVKGKGVQVVEAKDAQYVVHASYTAASAGKQGTKVKYLIDVTDKAGNKVRHLEGEEIVSDKHGGDAWSHVTDEGFQKVALKSATDLNAWIEDPNAPPPVTGEASPKQEAVKTASVSPKAAAKAAKPAPAADDTASLAALDPAAAPSASHSQTATATSGPVAAFVTPVSGAPGDGKTSLSEAMKRALSKEGIKLASSASPGTYRVQGQVEMGPSNNGEQSIVIRWAVFDPSGKQKEKTVVQKNTIPAGSLDKAWGTVADQAASMAALEVMKLLNPPPAGQAQLPGGSAG
jgi:hypothetical protein